MKVVRFLLAIVVVVSLTPVIQGEEGVSGRARIELALRDYAKLMCSAVFISGRDLPEAERDSGPLVTENIGSSYSVFTEADRATARVHIDRKGKVVTAPFRDFAPGIARFYGDQGCVILPRGVQNAFFTPKKVSTRLPPADTQSWPMGNVTPPQPLPDGILAHAEARGRVEKPASAFDRALTSTNSKIICASPRLRSGVGSRPSRVPKAKSSRANGSSAKLICVVSVR